MKKNIIIKPLISFILSLLLMLSITLTTMIATYAINNSDNIYDNETVLLIISLIIIIIPIFVFISTIINEIRINKVKINNKISSNEIEKYKLDEKEIYDECLNYFNRLQESLYNNDHNTIKSLLSDKCFDNYMTIYDEFNNRNLGTKYEILDFNLVNIEDHHGVLFLNYEIKLLQSINLLKKITINKRKLLCYKMTFSYSPIINKKNCDNCGNVLNNTYRCQSCNTMLEYDKHHLKIEDINIFKEIDRWC